MTLVVRALDCGYSGRPVLSAIDLEVHPGELVAVLGANGAGKSTLLKTISGVLAPLRGSIEFDGVAVQDYPARKRFAAGIAWVPEGRRLFADMTVRENLLIGLGARRPSGWKDRWDQLLELFPVLGRYLDRPATALSGGEQQMVALGRALVPGPRLVLLDEPSLGLAPMLVEAVMAAIGRLCSGDMSVLLVEQNVPAGLSIAQRAIVIERGAIVRRGTAAEVLSDDAIIRSYLSHSG